MCNITVGRYDDPGSVGYSGWVLPENEAWVLFNRDPVTGAVK